MSDTCPHCGSSTEQPCYADCPTRLKEENKRLRAALENIEQIALQYVHMKYARLARAAIKEKTDGNRT